MSPPTVAARASEFLEDDRTPEDDEREEEGLEEPEEARAGRRALATRLREVAVLNEQKFVLADLVAARLV